ncbi:PEP-CTERM sorting domain-containing protein [Methylophilus flavus]|uniref:PEP-CTERM sorting domain-containing protein n=1 Tax=Methylophilus flavus TaxID=640084 RepID=A0ABW3PC58_9PROT
MNTANGYPYQWLYFTPKETPGLKILGTPLAAVPEPESLVMLIAGLGLISLCVRNRKN